MRRFIGLLTVAVAAASLGLPAVAPAPATAAPLPAATSALAAAKVAAPRTYSYGSHPSQKYDLYRAGAGRRATVVVVHGGGWVMGDKRTSAYANIAREFAAEGYTAISLNYRLLTSDVTLDQTVADASAALDHIRSHATALGVDRNRIAVVGGSAGGHLAMMLGTLGKGASRVRALVSSAGMPALQLQNENSAFHQGKAGLLVARSSPQRGMSSASWYARVDPFANAGSGDAPLLWLGSTRDTYVHPELAWRMASKLRFGRVPTKVIVVDDTVHGPIQGDYAHRDAAWKQMRDWISARLNGRYPTASRVSAALTAHRTGSTVTVRASAETNDTPDSAPFSTQYKLFVARRDGNRLRPYTVDRTGRFSSGLATHTYGRAGMTQKLSDVSAGAKIKLVIYGNGAATTRTVTVR